MVAGDRKLVHTPFVPAGYWSPCVPLIWNPVKAPDIGLSSSQFRKQHPGHEKAVMVDWIMKTPTSEGKHGIQWTAQNQLDDLDFADDLALLSHTHEQMQIKTTSVAAASA
ncbi:unnamed protein product [Schistosoma margrebowiei]|uniref:Uncharacterized protein n=1 Tax=Schistosoma margrebowiei TaxID=48269 RepID=A0A183M1S6_9TREM|nr:unnamed protein product [Schistosoma margrebowiei]